MRQTLDATWESARDADVIIFHPKTGIGLILLGVGMFGAPTFGIDFGRVIAVLGVVGLVAAALQMVDPPSVTA